MLLTGGHCWAIREHLKKFGCTTHYGDVPSSAVVQDADVVVFSIVRVETTTSVERPTLSGRFRRYEFEVTFTDSDRIKWDRGLPIPVPHDIQVV